MRRAFALTAVALLAMRAGAAAQSGNGVPVVTLEQARQRAQSIDSRGVAARGQVETAAWERRSAFTDLVTPHVSAGTSYTRFSDPFFNFGTGDNSNYQATLNKSYDFLVSLRFIAK